MISFYMLLYVQLLSTYLLREKERHLQFYTFLFFLVRKWKKSYSIYYANRVDDDTIKKKYKSSIKITFISLISDLFSSFHPNIHIKSSLLLQNLESNNNDIKWKTPPLSRSKTLPDLLCQHENDGCVPIFNKGKFIHWNIIPI